MILGNINDCERYFALNPFFEKIFKFVRENDLTQFNNGRVVIDGEYAYINICEPTLKTAEEQKLEIHREYIDIHFPLTGEETCGLTNVRDLTVESDEPFNKEDDYALFSEKAKFYFTVHPGDFYIVFPEDAHAPIIGEGKIKKAIAKVPVSACNKYLPF